jgi:hypothetical protein
VNEVLSVSGPSASFAWKEMGIGGSMRALGEMRWQVITNLIHGYLLRIALR